VGHCQRSHIGSSQAATQEDRQDRTVPEALFGVASGAFSSACACLTESQFPRRTPLAATPLIRVIPAAISGASSPLSAASTASLRTAVIRTLIEIAPSPSGLERNAPGGDGGLGEARAWFLAEPLEELVQAEVVDPARDRGGNGIKNQGFQSVPIGSPACQYEIAHC